MMYESPWVGAAGDIDVCMIMVICAYARNLTICMFVVGGHGCAYPPAGKPRLRPAFEGWE